MELTGFNLSSKYFFLISANKFCGIEKKMYLCSVINVVQGR